jgi:hypothetical protein
MAHKVDRHTLQVIDTNPKHSIFKYNEQFFGGTETMARGFLKNILPEMKNIHKYTNVIIPGHLPTIQTMGTTGEKYIFWIHNNISQFTPVMKDILTNKAIREHTAYIVAVSEYEAKMISNEINFPLDRIIVIQNAIHILEPNENKFKDTSSIIGFDKVIENMSNIAISNNKTPLKELQEKIIYDDLNNKISSER